MDTCTLAVLLVDEARNTGVVANLTLERLPDGTRALYPAPELSLVYGDNAWQQAMKDASTYVKQTLWRQDWDVRWRLTRRDQQLLPPFLKGGSLGTALALGLTKLAGGLQEIDNLQGIGITATVDAQGQLGKIEGEYIKLLAAAYERTLPPIHTVVVAKAQDVKRIDPSLLRADPHVALHVLPAATLKDAEQLLVVDKQTRWGEIIDCTLELTRHQGVVGRTWLREWVQTHVDSHASGYVLLTGGPGVGKSAFIAEQVRHLLALQSARAAACLAHPLPPFSSRVGRRNAVRAASPLQPLRGFRVLRATPQRPARSGSPPAYPSARHRAAQHGPLGMDSRRRMG